MFNARHETLLEKGIFKRLVPRQRCVVPLNGFYEWKQVRAIAAAHAGLVYKSGAPPPGTATLMHALWRESRALTRSEATVDVCDRTGRQGETAILHSLPRRAAYEDGRAV